MKIYRSDVKLFLGIALFLFFSCQNKKENHYQATDFNPEIRINVFSQVSDFKNFLVDSLQPAIVRGEEKYDELQDVFLQTRLLYKRFEWAAEYFSGATAQFINGPPDQEVDNADLLSADYARGIAPSGLQVMEELIFPDSTALDKEELLQETDELVANTKILQLLFSKRELASWRVLDAVKLQVFRILTLGITGFDNELTLNSMQESAESLESLREVLMHYKETEEDERLLQKLKEAGDYLVENNHFVEFDRAHFITEYGNPISRGITRMEKRYNYPVKYNRLLNQTAATLFEEDAFNVNAFAPGKAFYMTQERVELGERLFHDSNLSGNGTRSCATCHPPANAFTDGLPRHTSIYDDNKLIRRHTPTLLNAGLQTNYFFDMRALTLEDQADDVIHNPEEMDGSLKAIVAYLKEDETYRRLFGAAYPDNKENPIDSVSVLNALASYGRSLTKLNSRFDAYMQGDRTALNSQELNGFNLYMGKAKCATCHFMPLFNGVRPPKYVESEAEIIGVPKSLKDSVIDSDQGWYDIVGVNYYKHAFKTSTVRNAARTAPYMHNGIYEDLDQLMEFYNNAGAVGLGIDLWNQTLPEDSLQLTEREIKDIIAFIESLDSQY